MNSYYDSSNLNRIPELMKLAPQAAASFLNFEKDIYHTSEAIPLKTKELIAIAVAHVTGCPYCIDVHVKKCKALGGTREEIFEAVLVAASTRAGAILSHATHALFAFEDQAVSSPNETPPSPPQCFC
ncbi:carboxymuconolactone decarboxylase family protein [Paenibacillus sedimenti]|uniref:Carboxymuconolactone decarboxylase family protein n=1 Tax=Paenibacillus sedimenti TaxID=2770274 RepID=A0A926QMK2_9BACL|nr:carboxymuconolactone decarboxylase family protein [Paenibacillus sedimenti]MBD0384013.1 carboxymuconolactone decarboxylase family protein [Paenibacillus sedimenti]